MFDDPMDQEQRGLEDYWAIARRRRWWILLPLFICWAAVWGLGWLLPATYQSEALILIEQQKVPEQYVVPNVSVGLQDRLQGMTQQILSRTRLQATIDRFHLYAKRGGLRSPDSGDAVEQMRKDIQIELVQPPGHPNELTAFKIRYSTGSAELAQQVNAELVTLFIDENAKSQQQLSASTTAFLGTELEAARVKLAEQEAKVRAFKAQHLGDLPSQLETNVQILSGLQAQLQSTQRGLDGAKQQKLYLESLLQQYRSVQAGLTKGDAGATPPEELGKQLQDLHKRLTEALAVYTEKYPEVVALKDEIAKTEKLKQQMEHEIAANQEAEKLTDKSDLPPVQDADHTTPSAMMQIQSQLKANQLEIQNYQQREKTLESEIATYQSRLNMTPATEQQMAEISRGYEESKTNYNSLLQKQMQSQLATSLQQRQQGEQFRVIDPASLPDKPSAPNHLLVSLGGLIGGLALGLALTAFLELTNVRVWREKDLEGVVSARVLVAIPRLSTPAEDQHRKMVGLMEVYAIAALFLVMAVGNMYAYYKG